MIHINYLTTVIGDLITDKVDGLVCPQDNGTKSNAMRISKMAKENKWLHYQSVVLGKLLTVFYNIVPLKQITNLFGDMYYDDTLNQPILFEENNYPPIIEY